MNLLDCIGAGRKAFRLPKPLRGANGFSLSECSACIASILSRGLAACRKMSAWFFACFSELPDSFC